MSLSNSSGQKTIVRKLSRGSYIVYKNEPCRVVDMRFMTIGVQSLRKAKLVIEGLLSDVRYNVTLSPEDEIETFDSQLYEADVLTISGDQVQIMDKQSFEVTDAIIKKTLLHKLTSSSKIHYMKFRGKNIIVVVS